MADPQSRPVVITIFRCVVCTSVRPHFSKARKVQVKIMIATGMDVGLAEWIIDGTTVLCDLYSHHRIISYLRGGGGGGNVPSYIRGKSHKLAKRLKQVDSSGNNVKYYIIM